MPRKKKLKEQSQPTETASDRGRGSDQQRTASPERAAPTAWAEASAGASEPAGVPEFSGGVAARDENSDTGERPPDRPDPERIAARAYELYLARGGGEGRAIDDWLAAEGELSGGRRD
jgi:hypothetical protein